MADKAWLSRMGKTRLGTFTLLTAGYGVSMIFHGVTDAVERFTAACVFTAIPLLMNWLFCLLHSLGEESDHG
ncbi:hypothetical protein PHLH8_20850 [Pseudomonas sp. Pc102]|uniref:hypothetical protein n=1 Tax=Pseudomonas sp. Pc102 TaxID=2678261 RepID=UPI001BCCA3E6|nr:hypothetical protein [Pseudomonas sp. Pc102]BBP82443.1 hypothetical protein PHLH8_20850 [Pseudomonas sp. Pc102]